MPIQDACTTETLFLSMILIRILFRISEITEVSEFGIGVSLGPHTSPNKSADIRSFVFISANSFPARIFQCQDYVTHHVTDVFPNRYTTPLAPLTSLIPSDTNFAHL